MARQLKDKRGFTEKELVAVGLASTRQGGRGVYDRFRGRIIFPIRDASGNATGLGGRIVGAAQGGGETTRDAGPKYLNSPATLLFDKSRTLYLIDRAKSAPSAQGRSGGAGRGQHGRADGPPAGFRQRGRHARHRLDAGAGRSS